MSFALSYSDEFWCEQCVLCCVSRLLALRVSSHPPRPAIPRILRASRVTWAHALCMQPLSTPLTRALRPSSDPFWEQENFVWSGWPSFCTAVAVAQCLASSALFSRFKRYICGLLRRAALLSPVSPHAQVPALHVAATA